MAACQRIFSSWQRLLRQGGLPRIRFHDLHHTSEMLGHTMVAITFDIYSHVLPVMQEDADATIAAILFG